MNTYGLIGSTLALGFSFLLWQNLPSWITANQLLTLLLLIVWIGTFMLLFYYFGFSKES
jgi:hypothetical protein